MEARGRDVLEWIVAEIGDDLVYGECLQLQCQEEPLSLPFPFPSLSQLYRVKRTLTCADALPLTETRAWTALLP